MDRHQDREGGGKAPSAAAADMASKQPRQGTGGAGLSSVVGVKTPVAGEMAHVTARSNNCQVSAK